MPLTLFLILFVILTVAYLLLFYWVYYSKLDKDFGEKVEDHRKVWVNGTFRCKSCHYKWEGSVHKDTDLNTLECDKCGRIESEEVFYK